MIAPLTLGNKRFSTNLVQGPLAGVSCAPFRRLTWLYGKPAFTCTEMISCKTLIHHPLPAQRRFIEKDPDEGPVCFQLSGSDPKDIAQAVKIVTDAGADLIDLNCGCPVKKIRAKGAGSSLLTKPTVLYQLIKTMKDNTCVPVSIKIRVEAGLQDKFNQEVANVVRDAGADFLIVHGRHWTQHYETACQYDEIKFFVDELKIPVIGNGDVACIDSLKKMFMTGCAGVMIGRAGVGQPWLIQELVAKMQGQSFLPPTLSEIGLLYIDHIERLIQLLGNEKFAILQARKFAKYYARGILNKEQFCSEVSVCETLQELKTACSRYFF